MEKRVTFRFDQMKKALEPSIQDEAQLSIAITGPNFVVARYKNGKIIKGSTYNFNPQRKVFHIVPRAKEDERIYEVSFAELKAVFFVKSLEGRKDHPPAKATFEEDVNIGGARKVKVGFVDGETIIGATHGYDPERHGFFIHPLDKETNNWRIFVMSKAIKYLEIRR
jgi:hypothetical protein